MLLEIDQDLIKYRMWLQMHEIRYIQNSNINQEILKVLSNN